MSTVLLLVVTLGATFGFMAYMRKRVGGQTAHLKAGVLAPRLGMRVVEGDPEHNLATMSVEPSARNTGSAKGFVKQMAVTQLGGDLGAFRLVMAGATAEGAPTELVLSCRQDYEVGAFHDTIGTSYDLRLTVAARTTFPAFDIRLRAPRMGMEVASVFGAAPVPYASFGDPALDERFVIQCEDPTLARRIAPLLAPLLAQELYVHVVGTPGQISFVMTPASVNAAAFGFEATLGVLAQIGRALEGRQPAVAPAPSLAFAHR